MDRARVRRLGLPREVAVSTDTTGRPVAVGGRPVEHLRDQWRVEEGWWTRRPVRRVYFDLVLAGGHQTVVFCDRRRGCWYAQRS
jgi:hypothetical protein